MSGEVWNSEIFINNNITVNSFIDTAYSWLILILIIHENYLNIVYNFG
jgi:hypothetical protein